MLRFLKRNPWLVAVCMLMLATLACSPPYQPPKPYIDAVLVDKANPEHAYARLIYYSRYGEAQLRDGQEPHVYQTDDYGQTWQRSAFKFPEEITNDYPLKIYGEAIWLDSQILWEFPRETFRNIFFYPAGLFGDPYPLFLPSGELSNSAANGVIYAAMGTEGVLIGRFDGDQPMWEHINWSLENRRMDALTPMKLTVDEPITIIAVIIMALLFPPLPFIQWYVLRHVWVYGVAMGRASVGAAVISLILCFCAAVAITIWLTNVNTDYYPMVAIMTIVTVLVSTIGGFFLMHGVDLRFRLWLMIPTVLVSLIVPIGVASVWWLWPVIIFMLVGFEEYRYKFTKDYEAFFSQVTYPHHQWHVDRLAIEIVLLGFSVVVSLLVLLLGLLGRVSDPIPVILVMLLTVVFVGSKFLRWYVAIRFGQLFAENTIGSVQVTPVVLVSSTREETNSVLVHIFGTIFLAGGLFIAQGYVQGWLRSLVR